MWSVNPPRPPPEDSIFWIQQILSKNFPLSFYHSHHKRLPLRKVQLGILSELKEFYFLQQPTSYAKSRILDGTNDEKCDEKSYAKKKQQTRHQWELKMKILMKACHFTKKLTKIVNVTVIFYQKLSKSRAEGKSPMRWQGCLEISNHVFLKK